MSKDNASMSTMEAISRRSSVRSYSPERLDPTTIHTLLAAAVRAPTAVHLEPWAFAIIQDSSTLKRLSDVAKPLFLEEHGAPISIAGDTRSTCLQARTLTSSITPARS